MLKLVMDGERNLGEVSLTKFINALGFNKEEQEFFRNLVYFNQSKTHHEKNHFYQAILKSRQTKLLKPIEQHQYEYYSTWYHPVIRELIESPEFDGTPKWLAQQLNPTIKTIDAKKSLELLEKLGFIECYDTNRWRQTEPIISTGPELKSLTFFNYHKNLLKISYSALDNVPAHLRDISAVTLGVSPQDIPLLKEKITAFRQELIETISHQSHSNSVVQVNIQLIPLTKIDSTEVSK